MQAEASFYQDNYALSMYDEEHHFYTPDGPIARSVLFRDWMIDAFGAYRWRGLERVLEIGAGSGRLLAALQNSFPELIVEGIEISEHAVALAKARGLPVQQHRDSDCTKGTLRWST